MLAEKLETVLRRGEANTRGRDFYDLYAIPRYYSEAIREDDIREALLRTSEKRGSLQFVEDWEVIFGSLRTSDAIHRVWDLCVSGNPYARGVALEDALESMERVMRSIGM